MQSGAPKYPGKRGRPAGNKIARNPLRKWAGLDVVYFIHEKTSGRTKIGTSKQLGQRLENIQACCPMPLECVAYFPGNSEVETEVHEMFSAFRLHGEWFALPIETLTAIINMQDNLILRGASNAVPEPLRELVGNSCAVPVPVPGN